MKKTLLKEIIATMLLVFAVVGLAACGDENEAISTSESNDTQLTIKAAETATVETVEESSESKYSDSVLEELLTNFNGPGDLAGSPFEASIKARNLGEITQSISTKDVIRVRVEDRSPSGGERSIFIIEVVNEVMTIDFSYLIRADGVSGTFLEFHTLDVGKVKAVPGKFDVIDQKKEAIGQFLDQWSYSMDDTLGLGRSRDGMSPFARVFDHKSTEDYVKLVGAWKDLVHRSYKVGDESPIVTIEDDTVRIETEHDSILIDKYHRNVKDSEGRVIATGATLENEPRKRFDAFVFDDETQLQIVVEAIKNLLPEPELLF